MSSLAELLGQTPWWHKAAACRDADPAIFFVGPGGGKRTPAKQICAGCPVIAACLEWALEENPVSGIWGGMGTKERRNEKRRRGLEQRHRGADADRLAFIRRLYERGRSGSEIATALGVSRQRVHQQLAELGLSPTKEKGPSSQSA